MSYIDSGIISGFENYTGPFKTKRLADLLKRINTCVYEDDKESVVSLLRESLDISCSLFGYTTFESACDSHSWSPGTKERIEELKKWRRSFSITMHQPLSDKDVRISLPIETYINEYFQECLNHGSSKELKLYKEKSNEDKLSEPKTLIDLAPDQYNNKTVVYDNFSSNGGFLVNSYKLALKIDNTRNSKPEFISVRLEAKIGYETWKAERFIFETSSDRPKPDVPFKIAERDLQVDVAVLIADHRMQNERHQPRVRFDEDTLYLYVTLHNGPEFPIRILPGWLHG